MAPRLSPEPPNLSIMWSSRIPAKEMPATQLAHTPLRPVSIMQDMRAHAGLGWLGMYTGQTIPCNVTMAGMNTLALQSSVRDRLLLHLLLLHQVSKATVVPLEKATAATCGAKAAACAQLATAAAKSGFSTPTGVCLPFGSMEAAIKVCKASAIMLHLPTAIQQSF
jgi:hypothetical protein